MVTQFAHFRGVGVQFNLWLHNLCILAMAQWKDEHGAQPQNEIGY